MPAVCAVVTRANVEKAHDKAGSAGGVVVQPNINTCIWNAVSGTSEHEDRRDVVSPGHTYMHAYGQSAAAPSSLWIWVKAVVVPNSGGYWILDQSEHSRLLEASGGLAYDGVACD